MNAAPAAVPAKPARFVGNRAMIRHCFCDRNDPPCFDGHPPELKGSPQDPVTGNNTGRLEQNRKSGLHKRAPHHFVSFRDPLAAAPQKNGHRQNWIIL